jgi:Phosphotransferase enzyme family
MMNRDAEDGNPLAAWLALPYEFALERRIFGSVDPRVILGMVDEFCSERLGSRLVGILSYIASLGCVFTVQLADGRQLVMKAYPPEDSISFLTGIARLQSHLAGVGFPCPKPLGGPWPLARAHALVMERRDEGVFVTADNPAIRHALASELARQIALTQDLIECPGLRPSFWSLLPRDRLYPTPHLSIFNLETTARGAEWIDRIARQARESVRPDGSRIVVGHNDWAVKDARFVGDTLSMIYDCDSLRRDHETLIIGHAAGQYMMTWSVPHPVRVAPRPLEVRAFIDEYEVARQIPFTQDQRAAMAAVATYIIAWTARLEHSLAPDVDEYPVGYCRAALAQYGDTYSHLWQPASRT